MTSGETFEFETVLRRALAPVEPPEDLALRVEDTLLSITELAADELEGWELSSMRDPRNWVRPVAAAAVGTTAGAALIVLRARRRQRSRRHESGDLLELAERTVRELAHDARKLLDR